MMLLVGVQGGLDDSESKFAVGTLRRGTHYLTT